MADQQGAPSALSRTDVENILELRRLHITNTKYDFIPAPKPRHVAPFILEAMPLEVLLMILKFVLIMPGRIHVRAKEPAFTFELHAGGPKNYSPVYPKDGKILQGIVCQILLVCKRIYIEAIEIYFSLNTFYFEELAPFLRFNDKISKSTRLTITKLSINFRGNVLHNEHHQAASMLPKYVAMRELKLGFFQEPWYQSDWFWATTGWRAEVTPQLLNIRGLTKIELGFHSGAAVPRDDDMALWWTEGVRSNLHKHYEVLKQPQDAEYLKRHQGTVPKPKFQHPNFVDGDGPGRTALHEFGMGKKHG